MSITHPDILLFQCFYVYSLSKRVIFYYYFSEHRLLKCLLSNLLPSIGFDLFISIVNLLHLMFLLWLQFA